MTSDTGAIRPMRRPTGEPNVMSPDLNESKPFCSPQDQIQWGILFLSRHLRRLSPWDREQCLQDVWEWARQRGDLLCLQIIRDYRECYKESGPTYRRHQDWFLSNWNDPDGGMGKALPQARVGEGGGERLHQIGSREGEALCI
jgi:hypothetical protein